MSMTLVYRFEAGITEIIPVGLVPEGIRLDAYFSGRVVEGTLSGATLRGIDYVILRADGVGVIDAHDVISTDTGQHVSLHAQGYITLPPELQLPPPEVMLSPEFQWPEVPLPLHGFVLARTGAQELAWMNHTALGFEGTVNIGLGELVVEARVMHPHSSPAASALVDYEDM
jgi:hypothetical protein